MFQTRANRRQFVAGAAILAAGPTILGSLGNVSAASQTGSVKIVSPTAESPVTTDDIEVTVEVTDFRLDASRFGAPDEDGVGHLLVFLDGSTIAQLVNFYADTKITVSGIGVSRGKHKLAVVLASNTHVPNMDSAQVVEFDYQPSAERALPEANDAGVPEITLLSPSDGDKVSSTFTVNLEAKNFEPSTDLEGKPNIPGYGHYHVLVDVSTMNHEAHEYATAETDTAATPDPNAAPSLAGLVLMPGGNTFDLDLSAWGSGEHSIMIVAAQNDHTAYADATPVELKVTVG